LEARIENTPGSVSDLVKYLPVQAIDADIGAVISGGPEMRRRMLDWGVFHVEHHYLSTWRAYRRALNQRNAALRTGESSAVLEAWEKGLAEAGVRLDRDRRSYLLQLEPAFRGLAGGLLGVDVHLEYRPGWADGHNLEEALRAARDADRDLGYTRLGPHRADLLIAIGGEGSRWRASRGQQKLLAAALVLALCRIAAGQAGRPIALLVDEPAADLDAERLERLMNGLFETQAQLFIAAISPSALALPQGKTMFHVEHGSAKTLL
jgi:DNA replication and repair protein RecF